LGVEETREGRGGGKRSENKKFKDWTGAFGHVDIMSL